MCLAGVTLLAVILTLGVTWLLHLDSLEADWEVQGAGPFEGAESPDGTRRVALQFLNVGRGSARRCTARIERAGYGVRAFCRAEDREKATVEPGGFLTVEVTWPAGVSCWLVLEVGCQTRAGRRLLHRFDAEIWGEKQFRIDATPY
jgi:hypothetical protein